MRARRVGVLDRQEGEDPTARTTRARSRASSTRRRASRPRRSSSRSSTTSRTGDCTTTRSNGEICCRYNDDGTCDYTGDECAAGLAEYESGYVDVFAEVLAEYADSVPVALVIEPDSVGNLVTNADDPKCGSGAYAGGDRGDVVPYAIQTLKAACADCAIYLDAAHGGWLGWENNLDDFVARVAGFGVLDALRGFATNVANYQPLGELCPEGLDCINSDDAARQHA